MATILETQQRRARQKLWNKLDEHLHAHVDTGVVLAVSGGPDSRALLEAVATWPKRNHGRFVVACIDHGIRKDSDGEAQFIARRAQRLGFEFFTTRIIPRSSSEHDLRTLRYHALTTYARAQRLSTIVTAHQRDDDAEGYVMALLGWGGGELGAAMPVETNYLGDIKLCRPFLSLSKNDLLLTLSLYGHTDFVRDQGDESRRGQRALLRHEILPHLAHHAPNVHSRLAQFGRAQSLQRNFIEKSAEEIIRWSNDDAILSLSPKPDRAVLVSALWRVIKQFADGKDLRSIGSLIVAIAEDVFVDEKFHQSKKAGLDPSLNEFSLKALSVKQYQVPGAVVVTAAGAIHVRRI